MSINIVSKEIERFLKSNDPEVLCISGKWGVGKTFAWNKYISKIDRSEQLALKRYAYVSLFGVNSLSDLRCSIVESTLDSSNLIEDPYISFVDKVQRLFNKTQRKSRPLIDIGSNLFRAKEAGEWLSRLKFCAVRE
ncbi:P-loop NTPase fold protein [Asaia sp. HN010]|uniref:P-loop NTPase fold protein n=1 Tax=Asaia sp. HN010 TaxID=3081233 RepID=UPI00301A829B